MHMTRVSFTASYIVFPLDQQVVYNRVAYIIYNRL